MSDSDNQTWPAAVATGADRDAIAGVTPSTIPCSDIKPVIGIPYDGTHKPELSEADKALAEMGYTPVFKREFNLWSCFSFALSISGLYATVMTTFYYPLMAGGPAAAIWMWLIGGSGAICLALSIAEIVSSYPTSGGMYFTIKYLVPEKHVPIWAWINGWMNLIGQIAGSASSVYGASQMFLAIVSIGTDTAYQPTQGHVIGVMAALSVVHGAINTLSTAWLNRLARTYAVLHIGVLVAACITLLVMQKEKHSARYAFTHIEARTGWTPGFSFLFGALSVNWTMTDYDATAHIAEEAKNPATVVPKAISAALSFTYVVGWLFNIVLVFCMGDPQVLLDSPVGQPVAQLFWEVMGKGPAIFFCVASFIVMNFVCITAMQAGSRTVWAFARDQMLPWSRVWYKIWRRTDTPVIAVWAYALCCVLINLIGLGSYITISAVFEICAICLDWSYCLPILFKLYYGRFERGPWHLGAASPFINSWACIWTAFVSVLFLFPFTLPVAPDTMNYAIVIMAFVTLVSIGYWYIQGRNYYHGPRVRAHVVDGQIINEESSGPEDAENPKVMA